MILAELRRWGLKKWSHVEDAAMHMPFAEELKLENGTTYIMLRAEEGAMGEEMKASWRNLPPVADCRGSG